MNSKQSIKIWSRILEEAFENEDDARQRAIVDKLKDILARQKKQNLLPVIIKKRGPVGGKKDAIGDHSCPRTARRNDCQDHQKIHPGA